MRIFWKKWVVSFVVFFLLTGLFVLLHRDPFDSFLLNKAIADASFVLIGLSFAASGLSYFAKRPVLISLRKEFGVLGFFTVLVHGVLSLFLFGFSYLFGVRVVLPFFFGLVALLYFAFLAVISNPWGMRLFKQRWRPLLRVGYVAFVFGALHFFLTSLRVWSFWFSSFPAWPPVTLLLAVFGLFVVVLRLALYLKVKK